MKNGKKQILWVDDEIEYLRAHIMFLEEHNYDVTKVTNGNDAIVLVKENVYDLVFLDEQMPGKDGLTTLEEIKQIHSSLPVVIVTKSEEEQLMEDAMGRNISGYLIKPVNPSQILSVCKSILHSKTIKRTQLTSDYVSDYGKIKAKLMSGPSPQDWSKVSQMIFRWDLNLQSLKDQGLDETHLKHKKDFQKKFVQYVEENYLSWWNPRNPSLFMAQHSFSRKLFPYLKEGKKVSTVVMAGLRMDQWLAIREFIEPLFQMRESVAWAPLPTDRAYCRSVLLSGKSSRDISIQHPELWANISDPENFRKFEHELLNLNLASNGIKLEQEPCFKYIRSMSDSKDLLNRLDEIDKQPLCVFVVEFAEMLMELRSESSLLMEMAPNETGFRDLTKIWFQSSNLLKILQHFSENDRTVVLTSDHGSILVTEPVEVFCQEEQTPHPRVKVGQDISCDERHVYFIESPQNYGLPGKDHQTGYALSKENSYFTYPNKYQYFGSRFKGQMVSGGLSMEEMLVPLITLEPKSSE